ncbi:flagellar motor protein MotB [Angustibacter aerolatus]
MSASKGRGRKHEEEEHINHERWLVSYADMMTLLMVLFIVMFAISQVDQKKFAALKDGLSSGFGSTESVPVTGGTGISDNDGVVPGKIDIGIGLGVKQNTTTGSDSSAYTEGRGKGGKDSTRARAEAELKRFGDVEGKIKKALAVKHLQGDVRFKVTERGLVVALISDDVFFDSASATIRPRGRQVLDAVGPVLSPLPQDVAVEGHANKLQISSAQYPTNWELSAGRASSVVRYLIDHEDVSAGHLSATGYGSSRPLYPESDPRSITFNRRVDVVVVSNESADVRALLPKLAEQLSDL